jgi:curved DNA-binding protein CbpA
MSVDTKFYDLLGVGKNATSEEIRRGYHKVS